MTLTKRKTWCGIAKTVNHRHTSIDGANEGIGTLDTGDIRDLGNVKKGSSTGHNVLAKGRVGSNHVGESMLLLGLDQERGVALGQGMGEGSVLGDEDLGDTSELGDLSDHRLGGVTSNQGSNGSAQVGGSSESVQGGGSNLVVLVLDQQEGGDIARGGIATGLGGEIEKEMKRLKKE